jgi:hypothetical protein
VKIERSGKNDGRRMCAKSERRPHATEKKRRQYDGEKQSIPNPMKVFAVAVSHLMNL